MKLVSNSPPAQECVDIPSKILNQNWSQDLFRAKNQNKASFLQPPRRGPFFPRAYPKASKAKGVESLLWDESTIHQLPLVDLRADPNLQKWMREYLPPDFVAPIQVDQISTVIELIKTGTYVGFVPKRMVEQDLVSGMFREIKLPKKMSLRSRTAFLVFKNSRKSSELAKSNLELAENFLKPSEKLRNL